MRSEIEASIYCFVYAELFFSFFHWLIYNTHHSERKRVKQLEKKHICFSAHLCVFVCVCRVVLTAVNDRVTQASRAHGRDYVRNWTGHSIMSRLTILFPSDKQC